MFGNDKAAFGQVTIALTPRSFSVWSAESHAWVGVSGTVSYTHLTLPTIYSV